MKSRVSSYIYVFYMIQICFAILFKLILSPDAFSFEEFPLIGTAFPFSYNVISNTRSYMYLSEDKLKKNGILTK